MTQKEFKELKNKIDTLIKQLEKEAMEKGYDILSSKFETIVFELKKKVLKERGISLSEYEEIENKIEERGYDEDGLIEMAEKVKITKEKRAGEIEKIKEELSNKIDKLPKLTREEVLELIEENAKPAEIINKIVKETTKPIVKIEYDKTETDEIKRDLDYLKKDFLNLFDRKINHNDLEGVTEDDHHQKIHSLISHLDDEYLENFKELISGEETTLHKHPEIEEEIRVIGSRVEDSTWEADGINHIKPKTNKKVKVGNIDFDKDVDLGDNTLTSKDIITTADGTITRVAGVITKLEIGDREIDYEYEDGQVKSWEDDNYKWELTKADGLITGWTVTKK